MRPISICLAEDDEDDCILFKEALSEIPIDTKLTRLSDGDKLLKHLMKAGVEVPDVLFLDLNMPLKNGSECLIEIKKNKKLEHLPVIIFSTSFDLDVVKQLYEHGAWYYLRKPAEYANLKLFMQKALALIKEDQDSNYKVDKFVINLQ